MPQSSESPTAGPGQAAVPADGPGSAPAVSVVMTVLNEARHLEQAVGHALAQDHRGALEVVVAVGPSRDRTAEIAERLAASDPRVHVVPNPTGSTPAGLNLAIARASHDVVVRADGHAMLPPDYVRTAVELLTETGADNVGGIMSAEGETTFQLAVARAMSSRLGVGNAPFHTGGRAGPADTVYLGVFHRSALVRVGGYDESFARAQDWEMNYRLRSTGGLVWFSPRLRVSYRPRPDLASLGRQYFEYGRWRRVVMGRYPGTVSGRYLAAPVTLVAVVAGTLLAPWQPWGVLAPGGYAGLLVGGAVVTGRGLSPRARATLPLVYAAMHLSWAAGFLSASWPGRRHLDADG